MPPSPSAVPGVLGNTRLGRFDVVLVGSGAGGAAAARVLATGGLTVCVLEAGPNYFLGLDDPRPGFPVSLYSNDEVKLSVRSIIGRQTRVEPMSFRPTAGAGARTFVGDVNALPKTVGGAAVHSDVKYPRFEAWDFRIRSELGEVPGASFADWPFDYDELEPYYAAAERLSGVQGVTGADPFAAPRSGPYPMETFGPRMYVDHVLSAGAEKLGLHPFPYPTAANSRDYGGRPPCNDCGFCSGYGCPTNAKGSPAVTTLRDALLTGRCQVRYDCTATRIVMDGSGRRATAVEYLDPRGRTERVEGDRVILAANAVETPRLLQLSDPGGPGLGNSSGMLGRNLMFHFQTTGVGVYPQRFHVERGRSVTGGFSDFRGRPRDPKRPLAGIVEFGGYSEKIAESLVYVTTIGLRGSLLKDFLRANPLGAHIAVLTMQAEDAPQLTNRVDLDPALRDWNGLPAPRVTYAQHPFELFARQFYSKALTDLHKAAGAQFAFVSPIYDFGPVPSSRHLMGTVRMGDDPGTSVADGFGKLHDLENVYCADGSLFVSSSGYNPTLTIVALGLRVGGAIVDPRRPEAVIERPVV